MEPLRKSDDGLVEVELATTWEGWPAGSKLRVDPVRAAAMAEDGVLAGKSRVKPAPVPVKIAVVPAVPRVERRKRQTPAPGEAAAPMAPSIPERGDA